MTAHHPSLSVSNAEFESRPAGRYQGRIAIGITLLLAGIALALPFVSGFVHFVQPAEVGLRLPPTPAQIAPADYFPAQYQNAAQNGMPEEHIQAF